MSCPVKQLSTTQADFDAQLKALTAFDLTESPEVEDTVKYVIDEVRTRGDAALVEYTNRFDRLNVQQASELVVPPQALQAALAGISEEDRNALHSAAARIRTFHERQRTSSWEYTEADGTVLGQRITPLDSVGVYVPGGLAAYPSSLLMDVIPAKVAGVKQVVMVSPTPDNAQRPIVLAAAAIAGVDTVIRIGGAQAVAALAYGTSTVPAVDKIVGPGNKYVAAAKRRVFGIVGIDMIAGPSEILVIADGTTNPDWVAMDLFSQAEHDEVAQSILLCPDAAYIQAVQEAIDRLIQTQPRQDIIRKSLANRGSLILTRSLEEACEICNRIAPEHMELSVADPRALLPLIRHAGAIFMGAYSSESLGDYTAGPNHVLPTARTARFSSPLGVYDFEKRSSIIFASEQGAQTMGRIAETIATAEGLPAHAQAARMRLKTSA